WFRAVWFKQCVPKHAFNFWVANLDRLPVTARLVQWGMNVNPECTLCSASLETRDHLLISCPWVSELWHITLRRFDLTYQPFQSWDELIDWLLNGHSSGKTRTLMKLVCHAVISISHGRKGTTDDMGHLQLLL
ncbi:hypothetical protein F2Q68_00014727, partial [Brassica cretica]